MPTRRILASALVLALVLSPIANAKMLFFHWLTCPGSQTGYSTGYVDDMTGLQYVMVHRCDGTDCLYPLFGPYIAENIGPAPHWTLPPDWDQLLANAQQNTTPGADVGLWVTNDHGDILRFRNCNDAAEYQMYVQMWKANEEERYGITREYGPTRDGLTPQERERRFNDALVASYHPESLTADQRIVADLVGRYMDVRFGTNAFPESRQENTDILNVGTLVGKTLSNITIRETPGAANGQKLVVAPVVPELGGTVRVFDVNGKTMWSGDVRAETEIVMTDYPAGMYFMQGTGKTQVVNVVR